MAKIIPAINKIKTMRQPPTEGELFLLQFLEEKFDADATAYFQPCFNGDRPDIVIINKEKGVIIVEVKDWELASYNVDIYNKWSLSKNKVNIRSPFAQAFHYKKSFFDIHVNGLLERKLKNRNFFQAISVFVFFYRSNKVGFGNFYDGAIRYWREKINELNEEFKRSSLEHKDYERRLEYLGAKKKQLERDRARHAIFPDNLKKLSFPKNLQPGIFTQDIYNEFLRYLDPPYHYKNEGKLIHYTEKQVSLSESYSGKKEKIKGPAGSGKTSVLALRAVNAHKRTEDKVLILSYNLALRAYLKDKINEVREDFSWGVFDISNYHRFMTQELNSAGVDVAIPDEIKQNKALVAQHLDEKYYSNLSVFLDKKVATKYATILIDETQDYKPEWLKIVRDNFLKADGEMVLFGDEKQNIYQREIDSDKRTTTIQGFGRWQKLGKSFRFKEDSHVLRIAEDFKSTYLSLRYEDDEPFQPSLSGVGLNFFCSLETECIQKHVDTIFELAKQNRIHPNDITILGSNIDLLREFDFYVRKGGRNRERTLTTFESKEMYDSPSFNGEVEAIRRNKKYGFNLNSGVMKISTSHSFKGYESPTIFLVIGEKDSAELVYVGLTRAKFDLVVFVDPRSPFFSFFQDRLDAL